MVHQEQLFFETTSHGHMADLTDQVAAIVGRSDIKSGIIQVFCVGSTWQQIIHLECDVRPRRRIVVVTVMGE
jgi:thiamine phosphate synthase YjbQ (UPF0047 family)